jgi:ubiquinone biosynthesis protein
MITFTRINRNIRSIGRYRQILGILIKYGFGQVIEQLNIDYYIELGRRIVTLGTASKAVERLSTPQRLRLAMEELGPTFIKLGQTLSTRPDLIPHEYAEEFLSLQDKVPPFNIEEVRQQIFHELGASSDELFAEFSDEPLAAASIGQVHRARLKTGEDVVLKIQRPDIKSTIETDLDILMGLAYLIVNHLSDEMIADPIAIVKEFRRVIHRELDYTREGRTIERFNTNFADSKTMLIPQVFWEFTGQTILTMSYMEGIKIDDISQLKTSDYDLPTIAQNGANSFLEQVLVHGLFHGDPHAGNILVAPGNVICMLDYGMVGHLDETLKYHLVDLILAIVSKDVNRIIRQLLYSGDISDETDRKQLKRDMSDFIDDYYGISLQRIDSGKLVTEFIEILQRHRIKFPADLILLAKALVSMEGLGKQLDPEFNIEDNLRPFMERVSRERLSVSNIKREAEGISHAYFNLLRNLPNDLKEFINRINRNNFKIELEHRGLERLITDLDKSSNRLSFSLLIGSIIVGSSLIMQTDKGPHLFGFPALGLAGYTIAGLLGLWLAIGILRSGRL